MTLTQKRTAINRPFFIQSFYETHEGFINSLIQTRNI